jgi:hypothetical protein
LQHCFPFCSPYNWRKSLERAIEVRVTCAILTMTAIFKS